MSAPSSFNVTEFLLHREFKDERPVVLGVTSSMSILATICFGLRMWQRQVRRVKFGWDDGFLIASFVFIWIVDAVLACHVIYGGLGTDIIANAIVDPPSIKRFVKLVFVLKCIVPTATTLTKLGILAMYSRIFPTPFIKKSCKFLGGFVIAFWLSIIFPSIFTCNPVRKTWDPSVTEGYCNHDTDDWVAWADGIPEFISCVVIFSLPIYEVWRLGASLRTKLAISAVFMVASLSVIASTVRFVLGYQEHATKSANDKQGFNQNGAGHVAMVLTWSHVEVCTGFIAACLPALRPLAIQALKKIGLLKTREDLPQPAMSVPTFGRAGVARPYHSADDTELGLDRVESETYHAKVDLPYARDGNFPRAKIHGEEVESEHSGSSSNKGQ